MLSGLRHTLSVGIQTIIPNHVSDADLLPINEFGQHSDRDIIRHYSQHNDWEVPMGWPEAVVEILLALQAMPEWMAGMVLVVVLLLAAGYVIGKVTGR